LISSHVIATTSDASQCFQLCWSHPWHLS
jgi:hypothetical protein